MSELARGHVEPAWGLRRTTGLLAALAATGVVVAGILLLAARDRWSYLLVYDTPIAVPFTLFLLERWHRRGEMRGAEALVDVGVVAIALLRPASIGMGLDPLPPFVSGHALFLTYALLTARSPITRIAAGLVLAQVAWMKIVLWHDPSVVGGAAVGLFAAWARRRWAT